jgi:hypothetical protein
MSKLTTEIVALADYVSLSKENKLTIAGIFDRFFIKKVPIKWPSMSFVAVFRGVPGNNYKVKIRISGTKKTEITEREIPITIGTNGKANFVTNFQNFPLKSYGEYKITLLEGGNKIGEVGFTVERPRKEQADGELSKN